MFQYNRRSPPHNFRIIFALAIQFRMQVVWDFVRNQMGGFVRKFYMGGGGVSGPNPNPVQFLPMADRRLTPVNMTLES